MSVNGWKEFRLGEVIEIVKKPFHPNPNENLPYIGLEHIEQQSLRLIDIGNSNDVISQKNRFFSGDILFGKLRPYFRKVYQPKFDGVCSTDIWVVRAKKGFSQKYLFFFLASQSFVDASNSGSSGTRMPRADWGHLSETKWYFPSLSTQERIAGILSALDDKIELNRQMNATLEAMAQAIFKEWFVDFNFPGATGEMVESDLGMIPKGWRVGKLGDLLELQIGGDWGEDEPFANSLPVISLRGTDIDKLKSFGYADEAPVRWMKNHSYEKRKINNLDILIGGSGLGPIGKSVYCDSHLQDIYEFPITYSNFCKRLRASSPGQAVFSEIILENRNYSGN